MARETETTFPVGTVVRHRRTGVEGTIISKPIAARTAGGAIMQRIRWHHGFRQSDAGAAVFVRLIEKV